jgi:hypothetical protein
MKRAVIPLALVALAAGAFCVVAGRSVVQEQAGLDRARAALAEPLPQEAAPAHAGLGSSLLGSRRDRQALAAAADWVGARTQTLAALVEGGRARAESELQPLAAAGPAGRRSWAATLIAVLELDRAQSGGQAAARHVAAARGALEDAVAADPANEQAKRDLELLLTLQSKQKQQQQKKPSQGRPTPTPAQPKAGLAAAGWGW